MTSSYVILPKNQGVKIGSWYLDELEKAVGTLAR